MADWKIGAATTAGGVGLGAGAWLVDYLELAVPGWALVVVGAVSVALLVASVVLWVLVVRSWMGGARGFLAWKFWPWRSPRAAKNTDQRFPPANLDEWQGTDPLLLWHAGCLWKGIKPRYPVEFDNPAYAAFSMLLRAAEHGEFKLIKREPDSKFAFSQVTRQELAKYAAKKKDIPEFLKGTTGAEQDQMPQRDISIRDALSYVIDDTTWKPKHSGETKWIELIREFENAARERYLIISGHKKHSADYEQIHKEFWRVNGIDMEDVLNPRGSPGRTERRDLTVPSPIYEDLYVERQDLETLWPPKGKYDDG